MAGTARTHTHTHTHRPLYAPSLTSWCQAVRVIWSRSVPIVNRILIPVLARELWSHDRLPKSFEEQTCRSETVADLRAASRLVGAATDNQTLRYVFSPENLLTTFWLSDRQITALTVLLKLWRLWASLPVLVIFSLALLEVHFRTLVMKPVRDTRQNCSFTQKEMWSWNYINMVKLWKCWSEWI